MVCSEIPAPDWGNGGSGTLTSPLLAMDVTKEEFLSCCYGRMPATQAAGIP